MCPRLVVSVGVCAGELDRQNVTLLMQPHVVPHHRGYLRRFIDEMSAAGEEKQGVMRSARVISLRRDKTALPICLHVSRATGGAPQHPYGRTPHALHCSCTTAAAGSQALHATLCRYHEPW